MRTKDGMGRLEEVGGAKMRVHLKGSVVPDLVALSRSFWEGVS